MSDKTMVLKKDLWAMEERFTEEVAKIQETLAKNNRFLNDTTYQKLVNDILEAKMTTKKKLRDYWLLKHYDVFSIGNENKLIYPIKAGVSDVLYYVKDSELFHILHKAHVATGHGGRDKMTKELSVKYKNVTRRVIELYISLCEPCKEKQRGIKKGAVAGPMNFYEFNSLCQVYLFDFKPDREYRFIMVYQDHLTKFVVLKALTSKKAEEVASNLVDIFALFGAPSILQSDIDGEFADNVVSSLKEFWPELKIVHGEHRHSKSQDNFGKVNQDIENMLRTWMQDNKTDRWSDGLRFVQFMKNKTYHSGIKRAPYEALFGCKPKLELTTSFLSENVLKDVNEEQELEIVEKSETSGILPKEEPPSDNMDEIVIDFELKQDKVTEENPVSGSCCVCLKEIGDGIACKKCSKKIHTFCGHVNTADELNVLCNFCFETENSFQKEVNMEVQAKKMKTSSVEMFPIVSVGTTVRVPIPVIDRGRDDSGSVLAIVMSVTEDGFYRLGTLEGVLKCHFASSEFTVCPKKLIRTEDVPNLEIPLQSVVNAQSSGRGQGFIKCLCKAKCESVECLCFKNKMTCTSKCHSNLPCCNK